MKNVRHLVRSQIRAKGIRVKVFRLVRLCLKEKEMRYDSAKTNESLLIKRNKNVPQDPFNVHPIFTNNANGAIITDVEGKEYIDFAGGIGVINVGHSGEKVLESIQDQIKRCIYMCFHVLVYEPYVKLA